VNVLDAFTGSLKFSISPYGAFPGDVRVATGDVTLDGIPEIITGAGPGGGPHVRVFHGRDGSAVAGVIGSFYAFDPSFTGGVYVPAGDVNGDGNKDVIVGTDAGPGGPLVRVFSGANGSQLLSFSPYPAGFMGGVRVATADFNLDGSAEIITGAGPGGGPHV